jgi:hydroxymethylbilane synthase
MSAMSADSMSPLRLGTRRSLLARAQSSDIARRLCSVNPGVVVEMIEIETRGDQITDRPLVEAGGKGLFIKELELALLDGTIDLAVHSLKDMPAAEPGDGRLIVAVVPQRQDPRDMLISLAGWKLAELPPHARVGTGSPRRRCQLLAARPDLRIEPIRGNIDTRLGKLRRGQFDAIVLARAGLRRAGLVDDAIMRVLEPAEMLPAAGQGALALQCRAADNGTIGRAMPLNDDRAALCVGLERDLVARLNGDCHSPIAAWATVDDARVRFEGLVGAADGTGEIVRAAGEAPISTAAAAVDEVFASLQRQGAAALLARSLSRN